MVGTWLQSSAGVGADAIPPIHTGRMQFQVTPPLFQWEGFRNVGISSPLMSCRIRQISEHFSFKPAPATADDPAGFTITYFVENLMLIPDPSNNKNCLAYVSAKRSQMSASPESYFFNVYQDANGQLVDTLRHAGYARFTPAQTADGCPSLSGNFADAQDRAANRDYAWAQTACGQLSITERTWAVTYDDDPSLPLPTGGLHAVGNIASAPIASPGQPLICGQGGDGSCSVALGTNRATTITTHSDNIPDGIRSVTTEQVTITPLGDLRIQSTEKDDAGNPVVSMDRVKYLQDPTPAQN